MSNLSNVTPGLVEHFCQWIWAQFTDVEHTSLLHWLVDTLEAACDSVDNGNRNAAMGYIKSAMARVCGEWSYDYREFLRIYFPESLAWREYFDANPNMRWDDPQTQDQAIAVMKRIKDRTEDFKTGRGEKPLHYSWSNNVSAAGISAA